jgi:hypothetical protein
MTTSNLFTIGLNSSLIALLIIIVLLNNLFLIITSFLAIIVLLVLFLIKSNIHFISYIFLILYGGGIAVLYFIIIQFNMLLSYTSIIKNSSINDLFLAITHSILIISSFILYVQFNHKEGFSNSTHENMMEGHYDLFSFTRIMDTGNLFVELTNISLTL